MFGFKSLVELQRERAQERERQDRLERERTARATGTGGTGNNEPASSAPSTSTSAPSGAAANNARSTPIPQRPPSASSQTPTYGSRLGVDSKGPASASTSPTIPTANPPPPSAGSASAQSSSTAARPPSRIVPTIPAGNGLRPSYTPVFGAGTGRDNRDQPKPYSFGYNSPSSLLSRPSDPPVNSSSTPASSTSQIPSQNPSHGHTHTAGPHHHHHHHHHSHSHSPVTGTTSGTPLSGSKDQPNPARPDSAASSTGNRNSAGLGTPMSAPLSSAELAMRERNAMQKQMQEAREKELDRRAREAREAAAKATSPRASTTGNPTSANPYPRPSLPPSPTNSRNLGVPPSASPTSSTKPSPSLPPASAPATSSNQRPNLPLPSLSSIGGRSLPSPFDPSRDRPPSASGQSQVPGHHRTGSTGANVGARPDPAAAGAAAKPDLNRGPARPMQQTSTAPSSTSQSLPPLPSRPPGTRAPDASITGRYPGTAHEQEAARPNAASAAAPSATSTAGPANRPPNRDFYGGNYPFSSGYMPFSGGFDYPNRDPFGSGSGWTSRRPLTERERLQQEQTERRRVAKERETARLAKEKADMAARRDEELRIQQAQRDREAEAKAKAQREMAASYDPYRQTDTALQQVAPRREPRPYEYKTDARDYQYTPRDKRPRMDAAVDDARRGNANKSRRRKEEDRPKSPVKARDLSHLTEATRKWPEVHSTAVETWLKTVGELDRVVARETYSGNKYRMSQHRKRNTAGGLVQVRIGGGFLGQRWKLRGEVGWDEATSTPKWTDEEVGHGDGELCAGWKERGVWGTDVYSDDSDLGLVLVHAGWIKWGGPITTDTDNVIVDVRIVPPLGRYFPTERNGIRSRGWGNGHDGGSIVIEAVRRIPATAAILDGRKNRKRRLAELALQRDHVFGVDCLPRPVLVQERTPLAEEIRRINGVYDSVDPILTFERDGAAFKFTPAALETMLVVDTETNAPPTLWSNDLELDSGSDRYRLSVLPSSVDEPSLRLIHTPLHPTSTKVDENNRSTVFEDLPAYCLAWTEDGLAFWQSKPDSDVVEPRLCRVNGYRWIKRDVEWKATTVSMEVDP